MPGKSFALGSVALAIVWGTFFYPPPPPKRAAAPAALSQATPASAMPAGPHLVR